MLISKTIIYQEHEYFVTHEFEGNQVWAYREVQHDIIDVYHFCMGVVTVDRLLVPTIRQIFEMRDLVLEYQAMEEQERLNYELIKAIEEGSELLER